ncbi:MAG: hypothetical protein Q8Q49_01915 [bacterium]|nr:hypothetical protein [bacterium]
MVRTIFHKTKIDLQRWFLAIALVLNAEKAISARQLAQKIKVNKNTGWFMLMRIRNAMREQREFIEKIINADDVYAKGKTNHSFNY